MAVKSFKTFEEDSNILDDLESLGIEKHKGWIVCTMGYYDSEAGAEIHGVVARNIPEACQMILSEMAFSEEAIEEAKKVEDFSDLSDIIENEMGFGARHWLIEVYDDLKPRKSESVSLLIDWTNPVMAVKDLKYLFSNVDDIMLKSYGPK